MKTSVISLAVPALLLAVPVAAQAQKISPVSVAVVNRDKVYNECNACKVAITQIETQIQQYQQRAQQLATPLQTEAQAIETEAKALDPLVKALNGKQPDVALNTRINAFQQKQRAFQQKQAQGQQELGQREQTISRNRSFVAQQIDEKFNPVVQQVMATRGAGLMVDMGTTLAHAASIDVTNDVIAALNVALTTLNTTAPPPQQAPAGTTPPKPQGR